MSNAAPIVQIAPTTIAPSETTALSVALDPNGSALAGFIIVFKIDPAKINLVSLVPETGIAPSGSAGEAQFSLDATPKGGERMQMTEVGLFTVKDGKVVQEEFLYLMG